MLRTSSEILAPIREKVEAGERLTFDDGLLLESPEVPLPELGELANLVRERKNGDAGVLQHQHAPQPDERLRLPLHVLRLPLRPPRPEGLLDAGRADARAAQEAVDNGCTEMHIVGGLHHQAKYDWYRKVIVSLLHDNYPSLHLKAWTPVEIDWFARLTKKPIRWVLEDHDRRGPRQPAGRRRRDLPPGDPPARSASTRRTPAGGSRRTATAHALGAAEPTARCSTGTSSSRYHRIDHLIRLRELQDETGGFQTFIPLAFHPENNKLGAEQQHQEAVGADGPAADGDRPADARQHRPHQGVLDHARHRHGADRAQRTAPTTSTAPSATS